MQTQRRRCCSRCTKSPLPDRRGAILTSHGTPADEAGTPPRPPLDGEQVTRWQRQLRHTCEHLGIEARDTDRVIEDQAVQVGGIGLALQLNPSAQLGEFYADCGRPEPWQEAEICQQLMQEALSCDMPGIILALHPQSHHLVAKGCLPLAAADDEGWLCTTLLLATVARAREVRQRFTLQPDGHS